MGYSIAWWVAPGRDSRRVHSRYSTIQEAMEALSHVDLQRSPYHPEPPGVPCIRVGKYVRVIAPAFSTWGSMVFAPLGRLPDGFQSVARKMKGPDAWAFWRWYRRESITRDMEYQSSRYVVPGEMAGTALRMAEAVERQIARWKQEQATA